MWRHQELNGLNQLKLWSNINSTKYKHSKNRKDSSEPRISEEKKDVKKMVLWLFGLSIFEFENGQNWHFIGHSFGNYKKYSGL